MRAAEGSFKRSSSGNTLGGGPAAVSSITAESDALAALGRSVSAMADLAAALGDPERDSPVLRDKLRLRRTAIRAAQGRLLKSVGDRLADRASPSTAKRQTERLRMGLSEMTVRFTILSREMEAKIRLYPLLGDRPAGAEQQQALPPAVLAAALAAAAAARNSEDSEGTELELEPPPSTAESPPAQHSPASACDAAPMIGGLASLQLSRSSSPGETPVSAGGLALQPNARRATSAGSDRPVTRRWASWACFRPHVLA